MQAVFYDLETSSREPIGQILNYAFIEVDQDFKLCSELCGKIKLSRLQLPESEAILANRINVLKHQEQAQVSEREAMRRIAEYIGQVITRAGDRIALIGYNSSRFDLGYLRTSLIRNGISPYFQGKLVYRDLLLVAKKLALSSEAFPRQASPRAQGEDAGRLSLALETLATAFGLLNTKQAHESRADVMLTLELAKVFKQRFGVHVTNYDPYEIGAILNSLKPGSVVASLAPNYALESASRVEVSPYMLLDRDYRYALWVDLEQFKEAPDSRAVRWHNFGQHAFFYSDHVEWDSATLETARQALKTFQGVTLGNFFKTSSCDIEADIYRIDFDALDKLAAAIWGRGLGAYCSRDVKTLFYRHWLANYVWGTGRDDEVERLIKRYALLRYGGQLDLQKVAGNGPENKGKTHPSLRELMEQLERAISQAKGEDLELLNALKAYYLQSDIYRVAGEELMKAPDQSTVANS